MATSQRPLVKRVDLSFTSVNTATTTALTAVTDLGGYQSMQIFAILTGATGGTLDIYLQGSLDGGTTWVDYAHFPQIAAGAAAIKRVWSVSRAAQQTTLATVGSGSVGTPGVALAANTIIGGEWTDRLRVVAVSGAGTSAGAAQTLLLFLS